jgi:50S ribosomal subunit-associated GTPase HflX
MDVNTEEVTSDLFSVLNRGNKKIKAVKENCVALVGLTRQGKSTSFNWILHKPMIGTQDKTNPQPYYKMVV